MRGGRGHGSRTRWRVLPVLEALVKATLRLPDSGKFKRATLNALLADTAALGVIIDTFDQPAQRPTERAEADTYYGGKEKRHTLKSQMAVDGRDGRIVNLAESVRGPGHYLTLLRGSGLVGRLPAGVGALSNLGYVGLGVAPLTGLGATPLRKPRGTERPPEDVARNTASARRWMAVEHSIRRQRVFESVKAPSCHHRKRHTAWVVAVVGLVSRHLAARPQVAAAPEAAA